MTIYLSGPITGRLNGNSYTFRLYTNQLLSRGLRVINPHDVGTALEIVIRREPTWKEFMLEDISQMVHCDAVLMLPEWYKSKGARIEWLIAKLLKIKVYYKINQC